jgi:hypothetical protein
MGVLTDYGVVVGDGKVAKIFEKLFGEISFMAVKYDKPSDYVSQYWSAYQNYTDDEKSNNANGKIFEYILSTLLIRENLVPYFVSAKIAFVPNVVYDITLFTPEMGPISLSAKTSLRERYKQADLESIALKYVHRRAKAFLITNDLPESNAVKMKIKSGDVIGLDDVIYAQSADFDNLIFELKKFTYCHPGSVEIIQSSQMITGQLISN